jgi:DNA-binding SARP family transcriptional activator
MSPFNVPDLSATPPEPMDALGDPDEMLPLTLQTFGAARVILGGQTLGMHNALLFMLVLRMAYAPSLTVRRATLLDEFWPGQEEVRQRGNLRQALYKLRTMGVRTVMRGDSVQLDAEQVQRTFSLVPSLEAFERDITRGNEPYGPFLPDVEPPTAPLQAWLEQAREDMHGVVRRVLVEVLRSRRERADWKGTQMVATWLLQLDPLNEDGTLALAECAALLGSKVEAVAILDRYLAELGPVAGDIRLPATLLRRRFAEVPQRRRSVALVTDKFFVGREQDLSTMTMSLRRARWHDGSAVLVHGPPGIGKSRLATEVVKVAHLEGYHDVVMECRESIKGRPLGALVEALPDLIDAPGSAGCAPESLQVLRKLLGTEGVPGATDVDAAVNAERTADLTQSERIELAIRTMRAQSIRHAVVDLFAAVSDERPIFLLVEDVHLLDDASWEVLSDVIQRVNEMRVYIVLTSRFASIREERPSRVPTLLSFHRVEPLGATALSAIIGGIAGEHGMVVPPTVERWILSGCEGNPLLLRALLEHWAVTGLSDGLPPSLTTLIEERIDRLSGQAQQVLQATSLLGAFATLERLKLVLELPLHQLIKALEQLELSGCLTSGRAGIVVTHSLVLQVATRRMSPLIEAAMHGSIADVLESEFVGTSDLVVIHEALNHTELSGRPDTLYRYLTTYHEALIEGARPAGVLRAIEALSQTRPEISEDRHFEMLHSRFANQAGAYRRAVGHFLGTLQLPDDTSRLSIAEVEELISIIDAAHRADPVIDRVRLSWFTVRISEDSHLPFATRLRAVEVGLTITANTCDDDAARRCFESIQLELNADDPSDSINRILLLYHAIFGDLTVAERVAKEIIRKALRKPASATVATDLSRAAFALRLCGDFDGAVSTLKKHFEMADGLRLPRLGLYSAWQIAQIELERGDVDSVSKWNTILADALKDDDDQISSSFVTAHFCRCAIEERNRALALQFLARVKAQQPKLPPIKASAYILALELACELLDAKWIPSEDRLEAALERHRQTAAFGTSDFLTSVLADSFSRMGKTDFARELISGYKQNARRERGSFSRALNAISRKLGAA